MSLSKSLLDKLSSVFTNKEIGQIQQEVQKINDLEKQENQLIQSIEQLKILQNQKMDMESSELRKQITDNDRAERDRIFKYNEAFRKLIEDQKLVEARLADLETLEKLRDDLLSQKKKQDEKELFHTTKEAELHRQTVYNAQLKKDLEAAISQLSAQKSDLKEKIDVVDTEKRSLNMREIGLAEKERKLESRIQAGELAEKRIAEMIQEKNALEQKEAELKEKEVALEKAELAKKAKQVNLVATQKA